MFWTAVFGLLANVVQKKLLEEGARHDLNIRGVYMHVLTDYLNSVLTVGAAILIWTRGMFVADAVAAFAVVAFMAVVGCTVVIEAVKVSRSSYR